jgi:hypothetical protein
MPEELSDEMIKKIRYYVKKYNSKINAANKLGLSYDTVLCYTRDIKLKSRKKEMDYLGINGKSLDLLKELLDKGYAFSSKKYNTTHYVKLKNYFPNIRRTKIHRKMIYYLDDKSNIATNALLNNINKKVMSYQELKQIERLFNAKLKEK